MSLSYDYAPYLEDISDVTRIETTCYTSPGPVPQHNLEIIAPRRQKLAGGREIDAIHAALVLLQPVLQAKSLHEAFEVVGVSFETGERGEGVGTELPSKQVVETVLAREEGGAL